MFLTLSCEESVGDLPADPVVFNEAATERFTKFLSDPDNAIDLNGYLDNNSGTFSPNELEQVKEQISNNELRPLLDESLLFLKANGFANQELISEFGSLDDPALIITAFVLVIGLSDEEVFDISEGRTNNFMRCLGTATGLYGIWELATGAAVASRSAILRAVGRFARRSLGWIGAAIFIGEFIQCYWGDNSVFDRT